MGSATCQARQINVFNPEERKLAEGDRVQWRLVNKDLDLKMRSAVRSW